jgi:SRSO17 transposase
VGCLAQVNQQECMGMLDREPGWLERLDDYVDLFRDDFRRRDQIRWASVYLQGLLLEGDAKTIGSLARRVLLPPDLVVEDVGQALQNFVNQSPWDERKLWRRHRQMHRSQHADDKGVFVLEDLALVKNGRHSVGVQRQYSGVLGRKTNCQIAVGLYHVGEGGVCPLALRLYLPRTWLQNPARLDAAGVPEEYRLAQTRGGIGLELLDAVRSEGWSARTVVAGAGLGSDAALREGLGRRGLHYLLETTTHEGPLESTERLVTAPLTDASAETLFLTDLPEEASQENGDHLKVRERIREARELLLGELGMDHFEGRSWRGFHHHACLVTLAYSFRILQPACVKHSTL